MAHDKRKPDLAEWVAYNADKLSLHHLICTGTTGEMVEETLANKGKTTANTLTGIFDIFE